VNSRIRSSIKINGIVQGVGFRPFIYNLAHKYGLKGWVYNYSGGVEIEIEGDGTTLKDFIADIRAKHPPMAHILNMEVRDSLPLRDYEDFEIRKSQDEEDLFVPVSPDISICGDCTRELMDPGDRRYLYPFINCTNCGPRFTITQDIPYDRGKTTMSKFTMCSSCQREYDDPRNRRFHAQPNACPHCGPRLELWDPSGPMSGVEPIAETIKLLKHGQIMAIKGLGGFHLACDAENEAAIGELRRRKLRTFKPFAVMSADIESIKTYCYVSPREEAILSGPRRPIVLLKRRGDSPIAPQVAPHNNFIGVMLPYTPLHYLLFKNPPSSGIHPLPTENHFLALVMTSANFSEEPITMDNDEALEKLWSLADFILMHDRDIHIRCDDSVANALFDEEVAIRRSRGFAPHPLYLKTLSPGILALGAELKNTFCLSKDNFYFISQHMGDLENLEAYDFFQDTISHYKRFFRIEPQLIVYDLHPDYLSTRYAQDYSMENVNCSLVPVQHHHAHIASCMAENGVEGKVIGVAFDGTGYGVDGHIWGGEFFVAGYSDFSRFAHLRYTPMPGADAAIRNPYRMALGFLYDLFGEGFLDTGLELASRRKRQELTIILRQIERKINTPLTSSCGRLFDAVSSLIGLRDTITYEGQAAIELEMIADSGVRGEYTWDIYEEDGQLIIDTLLVIRDIIADLEKGIPAEEISAKFHNTVSDLIRGICNRVRDREGLNKVVLSGGVFQNRLLAKQTVELLRKEGFETFFHKRIPTNDGGISLGQAVIAAHRNKPGGP
jgi:hydrogenase maturation protein HypF